MDTHATFPQRVYLIVASIPEGHVTTYGAILPAMLHPRKW